MALALALIATVCAVFYGLRFAATEEGHHGWTGTLIKAASTALLAVAGLLIEAPWLVCLGLAVGAVGDLALARPGKGTFLAGMAAFAIGHLVYVAAFWDGARQLGSLAPSAGQGASLGLLALFILPLGLWLSSRAGDLRLPVLGYSLIIGLMAAVALLLPAQAGRGLLWTGVALFLLSDTLLALRLFVAREPAHRKTLGLAVWPAYWVGQVLILIGATASLGLPGA